MDSKRVTPIVASGGDMIGSMDGGSLDEKHAGQAKGFPKEGRISAAMKEQLSLLMQNLSRATEGTELPQWNSVQEFLGAVEEESSPEVKKIILESHDVPNAANRTLLHWVCMNRPPVDVVAGIVGLAPRSPSVHDNRFEGRTPLHMACQHGASFHVIQFLVQFGGGEQAVLAKDNLALTPLHLATSSQKASLEVVKFLVETGGMEVILARTTSGFTALHKALVNHSPMEIIEYLVEQGGSGLLEFCMGHGSSPLHWACRSASKLEVIQLLVQWGGERSLNIRDSMDGRTPLHWAARFHRTTFPGVITFLIKKGGAELLMLKDNDKKLAADYVFFCVSGKAVDKIQAEFFRSTLFLLENHSAGVAPIPTETMLSIQSYALHALENGLHQGKSLDETPLAQKSVQSLWNNVFILRPTLFIVMTDLYIQIVLFFSYHRAAENRILGHDNDFREWQMVLLWICVSWHVLREVLQVLTVRSRTWMLDKWNWIDVCQIVLLFVSMRILRQGGEISRGDRAILTITTGIIRLVFIKILKTIFYGIAVFTFAIYTIITELVPFVITSVIVLFAFVHMFRTAADGTSICDAEDQDDLPVGCKHKFHIFKVFSSLFAMLIGELEVHVYEDSALATLLSYGFGFTIGLLFLNVLIAKITNVFHRIEDEGRLVFFQSRVSAAVEIQNFWISLGRILGWGVFNEWEMDEWNNKEGGRSFILLYDRATTINIWKNSESRSEALHTTMFLYLVRLVLPVILIFWFALGLLSFGLFWPRWMKVYFFFEAEEDVRYNFGSVKSDLVKLQREWKKDLKEAEERCAKLHAELEDRLMEIRELLRATKH